MRCLKFKHSSLPLDRTTPLTSADQINRSEALHPPMPCGALLGAVVLVLVPAALEHAGPVLVMSAFLAGALVAL